MFKIADGLGQNSEVFNLRQVLELTTSADLKSAECIYTSYYLCAHNCKGEDPEMCFSGAGTRDATRENCTS